MYKDELYGDVQGGIYLPALIYPIISGGCPTDYAIHLCQ